MNLSFSQKFFILALLYFLSWKHSAFFLSCSFSFSSHRLIFIVFIFLILRKIILWTKFIFTRIFSLIFFMYQNRIASHSIQKIIVSWRFSSSFSPHFCCCCCRCCCFSSFSSPFDIQSHRDCLKVLQRTTRFPQKNVAHRRTDRPDKRTTDNEQLKYISSPV